MEERTWIFVLRIRQKLRTRIVKAIRWKKFNLGKKKCRKIRKKMLNIYISKNESNIKIPENRSWSWYLPQITLPYSLNPISWPPFEPEPNLAHPFANRVDPRRRAKYQLLLLLPDLYTSRDIIIMGLCFCVRYFSWRVNGDVIIGVEGHG